MFCYEMLKFLKMFPYLCSFADDKCLIAVAGLEKSEVKVHDLTTKKVVHRLIPSSEHKALGK